MRVPMRSFRQSLSGALVALALSACAQQGEAVVEPVPAEQSASPEQATLDPLFEQAGQEFGVPADLLKAISYSETRWAMVGGEEEFEGRPAAWGLLGLRGEQLERGAALAGVSVEAARKEPLAGLRAGAALLSAYANELKVDRADLGAWAPAVVRLSDITHPDARSQYVHQYVYEVLRTGAVAEGESGQVRVSLMPRQVEAKYELPRLRAQNTGPDYPPAIWRPSPNFNSRPTGSTGGEQMIIIHTCQGAYSGCWSWLNDTRSGVSAHYVVNESGSEVSQLVREFNRAWHVAASYSCSVNGSVKCGLNGVSVNHFSVGIEHGGFVSNTYSSGLITTSARLTCDIARDNNIPRDSFHIVSHQRLQSDRNDPGPNWPWSSFLNQVNSFCGTTSTGLIVDNNNANNNSTQARVEFSTNWLASTSNPPFYGSNYHYATTEAVSDGFTFWFNMTAAGTRTVDVWYTSWTNRSTAAPFIVYNASGTELGRVSINQQINGGQWVTLGTYNFTAGWNRVVLSRWAPQGFVVIADAIRVR